MIPVRLEITNFLAYCNPDPLDFSGIHVGVLVGENGAGKSSLLDAITWAVWGRARAKVDGDLVHQGAAEMRVQFTFALGDQHYRVLRARKAGKNAGSLLEFQACGPSGQWVSIGGDTIRQTQDKIVRTLRLTYETFCNSAYLVQGQADEFTSKPPGERKQVLADILGLQEWERYEERAKDKLKTIDTRLAGIDALLKEIETELARRPDYERELSEAQARVIEVGERLRQAEAGWAQIDLARQAMVSLERQLTDIIRRLKDTQRELDELDRDLRQARSRADTANLQRELETAQRHLAELDDLEVEKERQAEARLSLFERGAELRAQNEAARADADGLKKRLETLLAATEPLCPTCGQPLDEAARAALSASLNADLEVRRALYRDNQARLKVFQDETNVLDKWLHENSGKLKGKPAHLKKLGEVQTALTHADEARERIAGLTERRARQAAALAADQAERERVDREAEQYTAVLKDASAKQRALDSLRQEDTFTKARLGGAQQKLAALDGLSKQRESKRAERQALLEERGLYEELREAFGKKGVPAMMIEAAVPEIEASANALLGRMTAGRMHVRFNTQRETQAGDTRETLDIQIADELGTRAYENFSGGEQFRVNFAIRVALSQLLARRAGTQLQTLIMDEGFGVLDATGRERLVEAINAAQQDFQRILVVTHIDELKDAFPARIEITKGPNGSEIAVA
jgi:exonuclease SbcC